MNPFQILRKGYLYKEILKNNEIVWYCNHVDKKEKTLIDISTQEVGTCYKDTKFTGELIVIGYKNDHPEYFL